MRAVRSTEEGIQVVDIDPPAGDGVRVRIRSASICGTDLNMVKLGALPVTLGHELAGVTDDGTPVAIEPIAPCGSCDQCAAGAYHLCRNGPSSSSAPVVTAAWPTRYVCRSRHSWRWTRRWP